MEIEAVRGANRLDLRGRVERKVVPPGVYVLTLTRAGSTRQVARPRVIQIFSPDRAKVLAKLGKDENGCETAPGFTTGTPRAAGAAGIGFIATTFVPPARSRPAPQVGEVVNEAEQQSAETSKAPSTEESSGGVLDATADLPSFGLTDTGQPWGFIGAFLLVSLPLLLMVALIVRFVRGSWDP